jgi:glycine/D-amino acid oxidase-like deaminating enzyme
VFSCPERLAGVPLLIDPTGFWIRPDGERYIGGLEPREETDEAPLDADLGGFEDTYWPALAARIPAFEATRLERAWAGYYDMNDFDCNAVVGTHPALDNLYFVNGFSGHGMQHAAAVGEALATRILGLGQPAIDLAPLGFERLLAGRPLLELNVIG